MDNYPANMSPPDFPAIWASEWGEDRYGVWMAFCYRGIRQVLRWIPPGAFWIGSPEDEAERFNNETRHQVTLTRGYWLADTTCTQALWEAVMGDNPSNFKGPERPVEVISWNDAQAFIRRFNEGLPEAGFRLPIEAEWEYACRAKVEMPFWFGANITTEQANFDGRYPYAGGAEGKSRGETVDVKALPCNAWGLYQMHGNVCEWCADWFGEYPKLDVADPLGPIQGDKRVMRGGAWNLHGRHIRSALRDCYKPDYRDVNSGFRLARG